MLLSGPLNVQAKKQGAGDACAKKGRGGVKVIQFDAAGKHIFGALTFKSTQVKGTDVPLAARLSKRFRTARDQILKDIILSERQLVEGRFRVLDLGGRADYWERVGFGFLETHDIEVVCVNQTESELYSGKISHPRLSARVGDACNLNDLPDLFFNMVHSNSVIEHVGPFASKRAFANEVRRLAPVHYVQTPYAWFPIDPHWPKFPIFHWLPLSLRQKLLRRYGLGWGGRCASVDHAMRDLESTVLLDRTQMKSLFPEASLQIERFFGFPKSLIAVRRTARSTSLNIDDRWLEQMQNQIGV